MARTGHTYMLLSFTILSAVTYSQRIRVYDVMEDVEESSSLTFIGDLKDISVISNLDSSVKDLMKFRRVQQGNPHEALFSLSSEGVLRTDSYIDRESLCPGEDLCILDIIVIASTESATRPFFKRLTVGISIMDQNDHTPKFTPDTEMRSIPENTAVGQSVRIPLADDPDSPDNGVGEYRLVSGGPTFTLHTARDIKDRVTDIYLVLDQAVDREIRDSYSCVVEVIDNGDASKTDTLTVEIQITDVNDHPPKFDKNTYVAEVREDAELRHMIIKVKAIDPDDGNNGKVIYGFSAQTPDDVLSLFTINNMTGEVRLVRELDYEKQSSYSVVVTARGLTSHWLPGEAKLELQVLDVNDNPPHVTVDSVQGEPNVTVAENQPDDTLLAYVLVSDRDDSGQQVVDCYLTSDTFVLQQDSPSAYLLYTRLSMDREVQDEYQVILSCRDRGSPSLTTLMQISIIVTDVNDNEPEFEESEYEIHITENNAVNVAVTRVDATDKDNGVNGTVRYSLDEESNFWLNIDPVTGVISTKNVFDYEDTNSLSGHVIARDQGSPSLTATVPLSVVITDVNDEPPYFLRDLYEFDLEENLPAASFVGKVSASDVENPSGRNFHFRRSPDSGDLFSVNADTGSIYTNQKLDREMADSHTITLYVIDKQDTSLSSSVSVIITVTDVNDNDPYITYPLESNDTMYISNNVPIGYALPKIEADDPDAEENGTVVFLLVAGNELNYFSLHEPSGVVTVEKSLTHVKEEVVSLKVLVSDSGTPPRNVPLDLTIIINDTILLPGGESPSSDSTEGLISSNNMAIVIGVVVGSVMLIIILVVAIIFVRRQEKRRRHHRQYVNKMLFQQQVTLKDDHTDAEQDKIPPIQSVPSTWDAHSQGDHYGLSIRSDRSVGSAPGERSKHRGPNHPQYDEYPPQCQPYYEHRPEATSTPLMTLSPHSLVATGSAYGHAAAPPPHLPGTHSKRPQTVGSGSRYAGGRSKRGSSQRNSADVDSMSGHSDISNADSGRGSNEDNGGGDVNRSLNRSGSQPERPPSRSSRQRTDSNSCKDHPTLPPREPRSFRGHQPHRKPPLPTTLNPSLQNTTDTLTSYEHKLQSACERRGIDSYPTTYQYPSHLQRSTGVYVNTTQGDVYGQGCEVVSSSVV